MPIRGSLLKIDYQPRGNGHSEIMINRMNVTNAQVKLDLFFHHLEELRTKQNDFDDFQTSLSYFYTRKYNVERLVLK